MSFGSVVVSVLLSWLSTHNDLPFGTGALSGGWFGRGGWSTRPLLLTYPRKPGNVGTIPVAAKETKVQFEYIPSPYMASTSRERDEQMDNIAVVFDTNAYRDLYGFVPPAGQWTIHAIRAAEAQRHITAYATVFVIMELASHLWDENDPHHAECRCGLTSLEQHCTPASGSPIRILADSESLVAKMLFDRTPTGYNEQTERLCKLAHAVAMTAPSSALDAAVVRVCRQVADSIEDRERAFVADMVVMIRNCNPACQGWDPFGANQTKREEALSTIRAKWMPRAVAAVMVAKAAAQVKASCSGDDSKDRVDTVLEHCSATIALYLEILKRIVETGCDLTKKSRSNWIWDMQIALGIGEYFGNPPQQLALVTGDNAIVSAGKAASLGTFVLSLDTYLQELGQ